MERVSFGNRGNSEVYALHSLRIGGATALAAGGSVSREGALQIGRVQGLYPKEFKELR